MAFDKPRDKPGCFEIVKSVGARLRRSWLFRVGRKNLQIRFSAERDQCVPCPQPEVLASRDWPNAKDRFDLRYTAVHVGRRIYEMIHTRYEAVRRPLRN